jgi:large conductance mechanosensitive channel
MAMYHEFKKFIMRGNVVDLAVAVVIGAAFSKIVESLVKDMFMPIVGLVTGGLDLSKEELTLYRDARLGYGNFLQAIINFVIVGFCMFLVVKAINRLKEFRAAEAESAAPPEPTASEKLLAEIRDLLKAQHGPAAPPAPNPPPP